MKRRVVLAALVAATLLSACGGPKSKLDISMRGVNITVPRLLTPAIDLVPFAPVPLDLPPIPDVSSLLPDGNKTPTKPACPAADPLDAPALTSTADAQGPPAVNTYTQTVIGGFSDKTKVGTIAGTATVAIQKLPSASNSLGQRVDAWSVQRTDAANKSQSVEVYQFVQPHPSPAATASGVYLVGMAWTDPIRGTLSFEPVGNGLFILPNPVVQAANAAQYVGVATDPSSLTTLALTRNITGRKRVDLCGELVDTFTVTMTGALTSPKLHHQVAWTQQIATAYGAANVEETLALTTPIAGFNWIRTARNTAVPMALR